MLFGRPTLSRPVAALLARADVPSALYQPVPVAWYEPGRRTELPLESLADLAEFAGRGPSDWLDTWLLAGSAAQHALDAVLAGGARRHRAVRGRPVWSNARGQLMLGSSNGIRDVDLAGLPAAEPAATVYANRGLSGIDGTISTATGIALGGRQETTLLLGDVTFLHDAGGLLLGAGEAEPGPPDRGAQRRRRSHLRPARARGRARSGRLRGRRRAPLRHPALRGPRGTRRSVRRRALLGKYDGGTRRSARPADRGPQHRGGPHGPGGLRDLHARIKAAVAAAVAGVLGG